MLNIKCEKESFAGNISLQEQVWLLLCVHVCTCLSPPPPFLCLCVSLRLSRSLSLAFMYSKDNGTIRKTAWYLFMVFELRKHAVDSCTSLQSNWLWIGQTCLCHKNDCGCAMLLVRVCVCVCMQRWVHTCWNLCVCVGESDGMFMGVLEREKERMFVCVCACVCVCVCVSVCVCVHACSCNLTVIQM